MAREDTPRVRGVMLVVLGVILVVLVIYLIIAFAKRNPSDSAAPQPVVAAAGVTGAVGTPAAG
jgi:hypothetical protein